MTLSAISKLAVVASVAGSALLGITAPAHAQAIVCDPGDYYFTTDSTVKAAVVTHVDDIYLAPRSKFEQSDTLTRTTTLTASVSGSSTTTVEANEILAKESETLQVTVAASAEHTETTSVTHTFTVDNTNGTTDIHDALFRGYTKVSANWTKYLCNSGRTGFTANKWGSLSTFQKQGAFGSAQCPRSRYASGSMPWRADVAIGC